MKKIIKLTESDLTKLVKRIIEESEEGDYDYIDADGGEIIDEKYISNNLKKVKFDDLPYQYKVSLIIWMYEGDKVDWSVNVDLRSKTLDWGGNDKKTLDILINDYSKKYGKKEKYYYGLIPVPNILNTLEEVTGEDHSKGYYKKGSRDFTEHKDSVLPIIIDTDDTYSPFISDGWHRLSSYIRKKMKSVPVIAIPN